MIKWQCPNTQTPASSFTGFTLAELLISLTLLAVIAVFTIPKILQTNQTANYNAMAKEAASMISSAYQVYVNDHGASSATIARDLTPYMNYVRVDTTSSIDAQQTSAADMDCSSASYECLLLHNGSRLLYHKNSPICGTGNNALYFYFDPDGVSGSPPSGNANSVVFFLYANGGIRTYKTLVSNTQNGPGCVNTYNPVSTFDPPWFSW